jgi:hypothetical protein
MVFSRSQGAGIETRAAHRSDWDFWSIITPYVGSELTSYPTAAPICAACSLEVTSYGGSDCYLMTRTNVPLF